MKSDSNNPQDPEFSEQQLDDLLSLASWPAVSQQSVDRLKAVCVSVSDTETDVNTRPMSVPVRETMRSRSAGMRLSIRVGSILTLLVMAFVSGNWFAQWRLSDNRESAGQATVEISKTTEQPHDPSAPVEGPETVVPKVVPGPELVRQPQKEAVVESTEPKSMVPVPDSIPEPLPVDDGLRTKREEQQLKYRAQLQSVLECLAVQNEKQSDEDQWKCIQPLMARRAEFEYLLWEVVETSTGQQKMAALTAIGFVGSQRSVPRLMSTTADKSLRVVAIESLKRCADEATLVGFVLQQQDADLSREFARVLASRRNDAALQAWLHLVREPAARASCLRAADELSPELVERLFLLLDAPLVADRMVAVVSLGSRTDQATRTRLIRLMNQYTYRWEPIAALMWNGSPDAMRSLQQRQSDVEHFAVMQTASIQLAAFVGSGPTQRPN